MAPPVASNLKAERLRQVEKSHQQAHQLVATRVATAVPGTTNSKVEALAESKLLKPQSKLGRITTPTRAAAETIRLQLNHQLRVHRRRVERTRHQRQRIQLIRRLQVDSVLNVKPS